MSTLETAYELQKSARFMIASQGKYLKRDGLTSGCSRRSQASYGMATTSHESSSRIRRFYDLPRNRTGKDEVPFARVNLGATAALGKALDSVAVKLQEARERKDNRTDTAERVQKRDDAREAVKVGLKKLREQGEVKDWQQLLERLVEARKSEDSDNATQSRQDFERASRGDPALVDLLAMCKNLNPAGSGIPLRDRAGRCRHHAPAGSHGGCQTGASAKRVWRTKRLLLSRGASG